MIVSYPLILDGATGTELQKKGFTGETSTEEWVLAHPEAVRELHDGYIESGSQIVFAPTFGANRLKLSDRGLGDRTAEWNRAIVRMVKEQVRDRAYVCGDIGPTGKFIAPIGDLSFEDLVTVYTEQAAALEEAGADLYAIETMMTLPEVRAAILAVKSVSRKPVFVSMTCDENGRTLTGTDVLAALFVAEGMGADAFGLNCSAGPDELLRQLERLSPYASIPLLSKPNAGLPEVIGGKTYYNCTPEEFVSKIPAFAKAGVMVYGGCCGTTKAHIAALSEAVSGLSMTPPKHDTAGCIPLTTEKDAFILPADSRVGMIAEKGADLADFFDSAEGNGQIIGVRIDDGDTLAEFSECQYLASNPVCILTEDAELLEKALRAYQGRALYEGGLPETFLSQMAATYGLIF